MRLTDFRVLTFDCYGTLIDWESGIHTALAPLLARAGRSETKEGAIAAFAAQESRIEAEAPALLYTKVLARVHATLAAGWGVVPDLREDEAFGASVGDWPEFADAPASLAYLKRFYKLVVLSNVDRGSFRGSARRLGVAFDAVFTAEEIGSYKPDARNFDYLLARLAEGGHPKREVLHTAQSLFHDHVPATRLGLATAWIDRRHDTEGWGATPPPEAPITTDFRFGSLAALVAAHRAERGA